MLSKKISCSNISIKRLFRNVSKQKISRPVVTLIKTHRIWTSHDLLISDVYSIWLSVTPEFDEMTAFLLQKVAEIAQGAQLPDPKHRDVRYRMVT